MTATVSPEADPSRLVAANSLLEQYYQESDDWLWEHAELFPKGYGQVLLFTLDESGDPVPPGRRYEFPITVREPLYDEAAPSGFSFKDRQIPGSVYSLTLDAHDESVFTWQLAEAVNNRGTIIREVRLDRSSGQLTSRVAQIGAQNSVRDVRELTDEDGQQVWNEIKKYRDSVFAKEYLGSLLEQRDQRDSLSEQVKDLRKWLHEYICGEGDEPACGREYIKEQKRFAMLRQQLDQTLVLPNQIRDLTLRHQTASRLLSNSPRAERVEPAVSPTSPIATNPSFWARVLRALR